MVTFDLDQPLLEFSTNGKSGVWTTRHAVEGVQIFGGIGSGKTSGSGRLLALKYLKAGFGGLVLTAKSDEKDMWREFCRLTNRENDLIVLSPGGNEKFNFLEYESGGSAKKAITDNIVAVLKTVIRASVEKQSGSQDDSFWENALDMLIFNTIDLLILAYGKVTIEQMYDIVQTLPKGGKLEESKDKPNYFADTFRVVQTRIDKEVLEWEKSLDPAKLDVLREDHASYNIAVFEAVPDARLFLHIDQFFMETFGKLNDKTRSVIDFVFAGFLFRLLREPIFSLFCQGQSTVTPEDSLNGKIILIDLPVKVYDKVGRDCQILFKYIWQRAMEKRTISQNNRPVFLWADEAQNFLHEHDAVYQATARSSRIATVYISQNLPNYYASMGGNKFEYKVQSFLGTLGTKIFHANADIETNNYASELIGDGPIEKVSRTVNIGKEHSESQAITIEYERRLRPAKFVRLLTGGPANNYRVEGYMHRQGDALFGEENFKKMAFNQNFKTSNSN